MIIQVILDCSDEIPHASETASTDSLVGEIAKPAFDQV